MQITLYSDAPPDSVLAGLADRDSSLWVCGDVESAANVDAIVEMLRLPWSQVFLEKSEPRIISALEGPDIDLLVRRRGFIHLIDSDASRVTLPPRALPVYLLAGRGTNETQFEDALRRMTMLDALRRSGARQVVILGKSDAAAKSAIDKIWETGFRSRLVVVDEQAGTGSRVELLAQEQAREHITTIVSLAPDDFARGLVEAFRTSYESDHSIVRFRDRSGALHKIDLSSVDDPERPVLENYQLILDSDFAPITSDELPERVFDEFFRGERPDDWRPYAAGVPWSRSEEAWNELRARLKRLDSEGASENRVAYITAELGAGSTTLVRQLAFMAAREGYPVLVAKNAPFKADVLPVANFLTRAKLLIETNIHARNAQDEDQQHEILYEVPWLVVFDRMHWESREDELRRYIAELGRAGRPVCILAVTGPVKSLSFYDESRFKQIAVLNHMLTLEQTLDLGRHLNKFLRVYGKERAEWMWRDFRESHSVRYVDGISAFWVTLGFWLQSQFDLSDSIQEWVLRAFKAGADTIDIKKTVVEIAALSSERLPMPESLMEQGNSSWPIPLLLQDRRGDLSPLGLLQIASGGRKYWALAHDVLGHQLLNGVFHDRELREGLGLAEARDAQHFRFLILKSVSQRSLLGEVSEREFAEEFATTIFKIDPDHGRASWNHMWREVLQALDGMPAPLRNSSRIFRHHTAISRRRISWFDGVTYDVTLDDKVALLKRAIDDIRYALQSIERQSGDESNVNLYNSLANAYFDLARVRSEGGASTKELNELRELASDAARHAYEESPTSPYVIETHIKSLIASAQGEKEKAPSYCIEALEVVYAVIQNAAHQSRQDELLGLADRALELLMSSVAKNGGVSRLDTPTDVLIGAWSTLASGSGGRAPESLDELPSEVLSRAKEILSDPAGKGVPQVTHLRYQVLVALAPQDFGAQLATLELLVGLNGRVLPQLRLEYALLLFQAMRADEAGREFKRLRRLWHETDIFVHIPERLRWLLRPDGTERRIVGAVAIDGYGTRAMARVREFAGQDVPYRPQEFGVAEHRAGTSFSATVSFSHNGPFLRPVNVAWR